MVVADGLSRGPIFETGSQCLPKITASFGESSLLGDGSGTLLICSHFINLFSLSGNKMACLPIFSVVFLLVQVAGALQGTTKRMFTLTIQAVSLECTNQRYFV